MGRERSKRGSGDVRLVYSSGPGGASDVPACPRCGAVPCRCDAVRSRPPAEHAVRVRAERSGRRGKTVTVAGPLYVERERALDLLKTIKRRCGSGGTLKLDAADGAGSFSLEVQGDHVEQVRDWLAGLGFGIGRGRG